MYPQYRGDPSLVAALVLIVVRLDGVQQDDCQRKHCSFLRCGQGPHYYEVKRRESRIPTGPCPVREVARPRLSAALRQGHCP